MAVKQTEVQYLGNEPSCIFEPFAQNFQNHRQHVLIKSNYHHLW